jgi:CRP-like cAMP-binding protein
MYHAVLMLGGNDIGPRGDFQLTFVSFFLFIGAIINAIIFGQMAVMAQSLNRKSSLFQEKVENANEAMKNLKMPALVRDDIEHYLSYTQSAQNHQKELDEFLMMLSPSLKQKVTSCIFYDSILEHPVFRNRDDILNSFMSNLMIKLFLPEDPIIKQGEVAESLYFLARGECNIYVTDNNKKEILTSMLSEGSYFGEIGLLKGCKRTASVFSKQYATCAELSSKDFKSLLARYSSIRALMEKRIRKHYDDKMKKFTKRSIKNIDYLSYGMPDHIIDDISYLFEPISVNEGEYLFKKGTLCTDIHIISNGELNIYISGNKKEYFLDTLYAGCTIG